MKFVPLGEVCTLEYGKPLDKEFRKTGAPYKAYGANGPICPSSKFLVAGPSIIVGRKGSAGEITYVEENVWPLDVSYYVKHDPKKSDLRYLFYALKSLDIKQFVRGVKPGLNRNDVYILPIPLPSIENQRQIADKLQSTFAEIDLLEGNLELSEDKTNQLLQSILSSAFTLEGEGNLSANQDFAMKFVPLGEVCTVVNGGTPDTRVQEYWDGPHAWVTPAEMGNLITPFLAATRRTLTDGGLSNSSAQLVPKHSVIMSSRAPIGHLIINEIPMASNQGCKSLIPNKDLNYKYLFYFLYANKQYLNELGSGTTFAEISGSKLKTVLIPLPSLQKQSEVVEILDSAFAEIELLRAQIRTKKDYATVLRQSLLNKAFSAEETAA